MLDIPSPQVHALQLFLAQDAIQPPIVSHAQVVTQHNVSHAPVDTFYKVTVPVWLEQQQPTAGSIMDPNVLLAVNQEPAISPHQLTALLAEPTAMHALQQQHALLAAQDSIFQAMDHATMPPLPRAQASFFQVLLSSV